MGCNPLINFLLNGIRDNRVQYGRTREMEKGDVVLVKSEILLKRYGIWTGKKFILYGKDRYGKHCVHEESFGDFMRGAEYFTICQFPKRYGRPTEWEQPIRTGSIVMPQAQIWELLEMLWKTKRYKLYSAEETVRRAKRKLGADSYPTSEHFAIWCKTGIAESHELDSVRKILNHVVVY